MSRIIMGGCVVALASAMVGCATVDPLTVEQTARDRQTYTETNVRPVPAERYKIAIISKALPHPSDASNDAYAADQMEGALAVNFSNLGWFETVDRKNGIALAGEAMISGDADALDVEKIPGAQLALVAESSIAYVAKQGWKKTAYSNKSRGAQVITDFRLVELSTKEPLLVKKFRTTVDSGKGDVKTAITKAANQNAQKFARVVAARFLPEVRVLQTRGSGQYALVAMGQNYQATPDTKIDFFTIEKEEQPGGEVRYDDNVFAHGTVLSSDSKKAWVEVDNYKKAGVMKGHSAKVSELSDENEPDLQ